jgi:hypothetical protein
MSGIPGAAAGGSSAAYIATVANAIKACGTIVRLESDEFLRILSFQEDPLIVHSVGGFFRTSYKYLTSYRGLAFYCKSSVPLRLPEEADIIHARKMSIPDI